jgi:hypothetical protein
MPAKPLLLLACVVFSSSLFGQAPTQNTTTLTVMDQTGAVIPGARVTAIDITLGDAYAFVTNPQGKAIFQVRPGTYALSVWAPGFETWRESDVELTGPILRTVTLQVGEIYGPFIENPETKIPLLYPDVIAELPLVPLKPLIPLRGYSSQHRH